MIRGNTQIRLHHRKIWREEIKMKHKLRFPALLLAAVFAAADRGLFTPEDVKNAHISLIHACAVDLADPDDAAFLKEFGIGLIWSPVSNLLLYSDTPDFFRYMDDPELHIALGSDRSIIPV